MERDRCAQISNSYLEIPALGDELAIIAAGLRPIGIDRHRALKILLGDSEFSLRGAHMAEIVIRHAQMGVHLERLASSTDPFSDFALFVIGVREIVIPNGTRSVNRIHRPIPDKRA